ncbi:MAG TPA: glycoside hydrolase family 38 C-terminal domain-containing protein [Bacteroidota bacterium]|nr:glycoside hydrolase family 38 C-terminal domain-containing protein [Bacteroidota bacterium]
MKTLKLFFFLSTISSVVFSQSNVDRLVIALDSLSLASFNNWKASPDLGKYTPPGDPTQPGFDDSQWRNLRLDEGIYLDSCWIRKEIVLPEKILGTKIHGPMKLLLTVDDAGYLWVNGVSKGYFPWDGEFELTKDAQPGDRFLIAIRAINSGGPLRLIHAEIQSDELRPLRAALEDFSLGLRVGEKLLSFDTYQTNATRRVDPGTDRSTMDKNEKRKLNDLLQFTAASFDLSSLRQGTMDQLQAELSRMRSELKPVSDYAKRFTLYFDANAHIDAAWLWRYLESIEVCKNTFSSVVSMMSARKDFTFTQSAAQYYAWMEELYPDVFKGIRQRVDEGRWEVVGGMWIEPDCNLPSGESWDRHLLYSKRYFKSELGQDVKLGWNPDSFGYNGNMPMFYRNAGIDAFITQKIGWNDTDVFPYRVFWWESKDGSRILTYFPYDYVEEIKNPYRLVDWLRQFEANTGFTKMMVLFGVGDHGGGPSMEMMERIDRLRTLDIFPNVEYGTAGHYLDWIKQQDLSKIPTWTDELYLEYHQGTFTTQAKMKERNRKSEVLLTNAEKFSAIATMFGRTYAQDKLEEAWHDVLFNQFHDILPGSGIRENYIDANEKYDRVQKIGEREVSTSLNQIVRQVNTSAVRKGTPIVVFNALSWERTDVVQVAIPADGASYAVFDSRGKEIPSQIVPKDDYNRELLFIAERVPSVGFETFEMRRQPASNAPTALTASRTAIENSALRVTVDADSGWISGIRDKINNREVLTGMANKLQLLADYPSAWDAWNVGLTGVEYPSRLRKVECIEQGPVRAVIRVTRDYLKPGTKREFPTEDFPSSFFTQDIILYNGLDRVDFRTDVDWWEDKTFLKVAFPVDVQDTVATFEIPYGTIERSTQLRTTWERAKTEVPVQRWADLSANGYGVSLLNRSKYGYDVKGNTLRLSLLRSPKWPDPTADRGKHSIEYELVPHSGTWREANIVRRGYEYNNPLIAVMTDPHRGALPAGWSFVQLQPDGLTLTTIKKAEDSNAWIFQWCDETGMEGDARLTVPQIPKTAQLSSFLEEDGTPLPVEKNTIIVHTKKNSVVTVKATF